VFIEKFKTPKFFFKPNSRSQTFFKKYSDLLKLFFVVLNFI